VKESKTKKKIAQEKAAKEEKAAESVEKSTEEVKS
jgi:hypothetical protein